MATIKPEQLLAEIEQVLRTMPARLVIRADLPENYEWFGRAAAAVSRWDMAQSMNFDSATVSARSAHNGIAAEGATRMLTILHRAQHDLRMESVGPVTTAIGAGGVFHYFDEVRKVIETAKADVFFVDPYLDAEFAARYLPHVAKGVPIRLLGRERMKTLLPAVAMMREQDKLEIEVRSAGRFHDRYVIVDGVSCYQSGASFNDGARRAPTTLTQITDAFRAVSDTYTKLWSDGTAME